MRQADHSATGAEGCHDANGAYECAVEPLSAWFQRAVARMIAKTADVTHVRGVGVTSN